MNVLYISYDGMTDPLGQSQVIPYLQGLTRKGHQFWLLSFEKPTVFAERKDVIADLLRETGIVWIPMVYHSSPPVISTLRDVWDMMKQSKIIVADNNIDIVHCRSYISALVGVKLKKAFGTKFVFDMRGFWADERLEGGIWKLTNPVFKAIYNYFKKKELCYFSQADYTISLTENGKREIHTWEQIPNNPIPIQVIPCCADLQHFAPRVTDDELKKELGIAPEAPVVSYLGSVGTWYLLPEMLRFFQLYRLQNPEAVFLFISGDNPEYIHREAIRHDIPESAIIVRRSNREDVPRFLSLSTFSLFFIKQSFSKKASSPTKMGEIMGMGIPVICNSGVGDVGEIMTKVCPEAVVDTFTDESLSHVLDALPEILQIDPQKIRSVAQDVYALERGVDRYHSVYESVSHK